jgi:hypothetical protein
MNINQQEKTVLLDKKINGEHKPVSVAFSEINNLKGFEYDLTLKNRTIKTLTDRLNKAKEEIVKLKDKQKNGSSLNFKDLNSELFKKYLSQENQTLPSSILNPY